MFEILRTERKVFEILRTERKVFEILDHLPHQYFNSGVKVSKILGSYITLRRFSCTLTDKRNATIEYCLVRHVVHKQELHKLTMTRTFSQASRLFEFIDFCLSDIKILTAVSNFISFSVIY